VDDGGPRLVYNPEDGSIELRVGGPGVTVDGIPGEVSFEQMTAEGNSALALWIEPREADVLLKMIDYILDRVRITEPSRQTLEALRPRVESLARQDTPAATDA
jgi:hypothetical protein